MNINLRKADSKDARLVASFVVSLLKELAPEADISATEIETTASTLLSGNSVVGLLAFAGETPIGLLMLNECAAIYAGGTFGEITELFVTPECRSHGVASSLLEAAIETGKERQWKRLEVGAPGQPAWNRTLNFYLREDFAEIGPRLRKLIP